MGSFVIFNEIKENIKNVKDLIISELDLNPFNFSLLKIFFL
jgi:hypothetical protein